MSKDLLSEREIQEMFGQERRSKMRWIVNEQLFGDSDIHCSECGAKINKSDWTKHMYIYCYHCGKEAINPLNYREIVNDIYPKEEDNE